MVISGRCKLVYSYQIFIAFGIYEMIQAFRKFKA